MSITAKTHADFARRVARGTKWLDKNHKGWAQKIAVSSLDMAEGPSCVLGQMFGGFWHAIDDLKLLTIAQSQHLGFVFSDEHDTPECWSALTELWLLRIRRRQRYIRNEKFNEEVSQ